MAPDDDDARSSSNGGSARPLKPKKRVTLAFDGPPLALPDEPPPSSDAPAKDGAPTEPHFLPAPSAHDGWSRDRVGRGSGVHPAVSTEQARADAERRRVAEGVENEALDLVDRRKPSEPHLDLATEMVERFSLDDFSGALRTAELLLGRVPDHEDALYYADLCRQRLEQLYRARLGDLRVTPRLAIAASEVRWLGLDHRAGFLLSQVDGSHTVEQLIDVSGMPRLEVLKTLVELLESRTIAV